ncbi:serine hydrolase domain-containing protein [Spongiimicrobium salis]|uniref:serine hydrolase domain-containing protein n=1 Tax=Spongiimicrobium salis TaxID=1667022 RepID=UPI00374C90D1
MRLTILFALILLSATVLAQRKPITNLPSVNPEEVGFSQDSLNALDDLIDNFKQRDYRALIVIKDNKLAIEYYYNSFWRNHIHDIRSAGKSITSLLLGVAIQEGYIKDLNQDVYSFFPKKKYPLINEDYKKVRLIHLLNMVSGLDADSDNSDTPGNAGYWIAKDEWVNYLLSIPLARKPESKWIYADINAVLIGAIIEEKTGMSLRDFAKKYVFDQLEIKEFYWYTNISNQTGGAGNLYISALDFAKLGCLISNKGKWGNEQIVNSDYVNRLINESSNAIGDYNPLADRYGMLWYRSKRKFGTKEVEYLWASGNGGNHLVIVPKKNMVIAMTSGAYGNWYPHKRAYSILGKVFQALEKNE